MKSVNEVAQLKRNPFSRTNSNEPSGYPDSFNVVLVMINTFIRLSNQLLWQSGWDNP